MAKKVEHLHKVSFSKATLSFPESVRDHTAKCEVVCPRVALALAAQHRAACNSGSRIQTRSCWCWMEPRLRFRQQRSGSRRLFHRRVRPYHVFALFFYLFRARIREPPLAKRPAHFSRSKQTNRIQPPPPLVVGGLLISSKGKVDRCHPLLSPTLKISDNLRGPQRLLVTVGMDIKLLKSSILRIRRPVLYPLSRGYLVHIVKLGHETQASSVSYSLWHLLKSESCIPNQSLCFRNTVASGNTDRANHTGGIVRKPRVPVGAGVNKAKKESTSLSKRRLAPKAKITPPKTTYAIPRARRFQLLLLAALHGQ